MQGELMQGEPFDSVKEIQDEIASWGQCCRQCGARFWPAHGELFCDGC